MNTPKLNRCSEVKFPDIGDLHFYESEDNFLFFDATHYIGKSEANERLNVDDFFSAFDHLIGALCETSGISRDRLIVNDGMGNVYLEECLAIPFLMYVERWFGPYLFLRMEELLRFGVTLNDNMTRYLYETRFEPNPTEAQ
jgi:hypothetical protein